MGEAGFIVKEHKSTFWDDGNCVSRIYAVASQLRSFVKNP